MDGVVEVEGRVLPNSCFLVFKEKVCFPLLLGEMLNSFMSLCHQVFSCFRNELFSLLSLLEVSYSTCFSIISCNIVLVLVLV